MKHHDFIKDFRETLQFKIKFLEMYASLCDFQNICVFVMRFVPFFFCSGLAHI